MRLLALLVAAAVVVRLLRRRPALTPEERVLAEEPEVVGMPTTTLLSELGLDPELYVVEWDTSSVLRPSRPFDWDAFFDTAGRQN